MAVLNPAAGDLADASYFRCLEDGCPTDGFYSMRFQRLHVREHLEKEEDLERAEVAQTAPLKKKKAGGGRRDRQHTPRQPPPPPCPKSKHRGPAGGRTGSTKSPRSAKKAGGKGRGE